jgi:hypothetical protein
MASSISFWRVLVSVHSPFWRVFGSWQGVLDRTLCDKVCQSLQGLNNPLARRPGLVISTFGLGEIISCMPDGLVKKYIGYCSVGNHFFQTLAIVYLVFVDEFKKNVTRQTWRALFHFGEYLFQSTRHFGECLKKMVSPRQKEIELAMFGEGHFF